MEDLELAALVPAEARDEIARRFLIVLEEANASGDYGLDLLDRMNLAFLVLNEYADWIEEALAPVH